MWYDMCMNKKDVVLVLIILTAAGIIYAFTFFLKSDGGIVQVYVDGALKESFSLNEEKDILIEGYQGGMNRLVIHNGKASIVEADCPDHLCVKQAAIYRNGESIICLPHRIVIQITDDKDDNKSEIDAMAN